MSGSVIRWPSLGHYWVISTSVRPIPSLGWVIVIGSLSVIGHWSLGLLSRPGRPFNWVSLQLGCPITIVWVTIIIISSIIHWAAWGHWVSQSVIGSVWVCLSVWAGLWAGSVTTNWAGLGWVNGLGLGQWATGPSPIMSVCLGQSVWPSVRSRHPSTIIAQ